MQHALNIVEERIKKAGEACNERKTARRYSNQTAARNFEKKKKKKKKTSTLLFRLIPL